MKSIQLVRGVPRLERSKRVHQSKGAEKRKEGTEDCQVGFGTALYRALTRRR